MFLKEGFNKIRAFMVYFLGVDLPLIFYIRKLVIAK